MERDLQILIHTKDHLIVDSPGETLGTMDVLLTLFLLGGLGYVVYKTWAASKLFAIASIVIAVVISAFVVSDLSTSYRMDMDRSRGELVMTTYSGRDRNEPLGTFHDPLSAFTRADMEFDRDYRRITLWTQDGQHVHPLGPDYTIMDSQFNVLGMIQQFLGQPASSPAR